MSMRVYTRPTYQTKESWGYKGSTHRYTIHHRGTPKSWASFQLGRKFMTAVVQRFFGYTQRIVLPGIEVMPSGFGWYRVYLEDENSNPDMIIALFRLINKVVFKQQEQRGPINRRHYVVRIDNRGRPVSAERAPATCKVRLEEAQTVDVSKLQQLAAVVNNKYGHAY